MTVVAHTNAAGDVSIGVETDGAFVPFVTLSKARVAQFVQRGQQLQARAAEGDALAHDVLGTAFVKPKTTKGGR